MYIRNYTIYTQYIYISPIYISPIYIIYIYTIYIYITSDITQSAGPYNTISRPSRVSPAVSPAQFIYINIVNKYRCILSIFFLSLFLSLCAYVYICVYA